MKLHHVFLFPTLGENYGHVIQEALSAGCPCILSDQTPWNSLEENNAGYIYPLEDLLSYIKSIEHYAALNQDEFNKVVKSVHQYAIVHSNSKAETTGYKKIFGDLKRYGEKK